MTNEPEGGVGGSGVQYTYTERNAVIAFLKQPRILLLLLAGWSILSALSQTFTENQLFSDTDGNIDGLFAGLSFGWEGFALAAVYLYCFRNPDRYPKVFWLGAIHMGVLTVSILYHWLITGDFAIASVFVPLAGTMFLDFLIAVHLFGEDEEEEGAPTQG